MNDLTTFNGIWCWVTLQPAHGIKHQKGTFTCSTGGLCSVVVAVTVVWTVEPCLIMVVGVTGRANSDAPGACRTVGDIRGRGYFTKESLFLLFSLLILKFHTETPHKLN